MTREDVLKLFPDATDEQVTKILNQNNSEVAREKSKSEKYKDSASKADELQKKLDEIEQQNLSDKERLEKENEKLKADNSALIKANTLSEITSIFAKGGLSGDVYTSVINAFSNLPKEDAIEQANSFVSGLTEANKSALDNAKAEWEQQGLFSTPNPGGDNAGSKGNENDNPEESAAAKYAKKYSAEHSGESVNTNVTQTVTPSF